MLLLQPPSPPPPQPVQVLPWLAQPLTPLLWAALGVCVLLAVAGLLRTRRSPEPCPISPRWLAVATVVAVGYFAALSLGAQLANPITLYAAPVFILISTLIAWAAWHAEGNARQSAGVTAAAFASASMLGAASLLACAALLRLAPRDVRLDLDLGLGAGEAVSQILPALGASLVPLMLLPASHPRAAAARRAVLIFTGALLFLIGSTVAAAGVAMTTPLPYESPLSDRYIYLNALVAVPPMLGTACALGAGSALLLSRPLARAAVLLLTIPALFVVANAAAGADRLHTVFGFDWWRPATAIAGGVLMGTLLGPVRRTVLPLRMLLALAAIIACGLLGDSLSTAAASPIFSSLMKFLAGLGLFAAAAATPHAELCPDGSGRPHSPAIAGLLIAGCLLVGGVHASTLGLRAALTWQARQFSATFNYESNHQVDPEMRSILRDGQHAVHIAGTRWAWVLPQSTWWTRDGSWRDALLLIDDTQPHASDPVPRGYIYGGVITGADRKRSDQPFTDAQYVALIQPVPVGQKSNILHTVTARLASPQQLQQWLRVSPSNPRVWLAALLGLPLAWWLTRRGRSVTGAAVAAGAFALLLALLTGVGGVLVFAAAAGLLAFVAAARRDDDARSAMAITTVYGVVLALLAVVVPLAGVL